MENYIYALDVAHPPRKAAMVEELLLQGVEYVRNHPHLRVMKVVHGYGSKGRGGETRETVRNWAFRNRRLFIEIIHGEQYSIFDAKTQLLRNECGQIADPDLEKANEGITLIWVK